jgi:hypothetical protein
MSRPIKAETKFSLYLTDASPFAFWRRRPGGNYTVEMCEAGRRSGGRGRKTAPLHGSQQTVKDIAARGSPARPDLPAPVEARAYSFNLTLNMYGES